MAEVLDIEDMLADNFEHCGKFRWIVAIDGVDAFLLARKDPYGGVRDFRIDKNRECEFILKDSIAPSAAQKLIGQTFDFDQRGIKSHPNSCLEFKMLDPVGMPVEIVTIKGYNIIDVSFSPSPKRKTLNNIVKYIKRKLQLDIIDIEMKIKATGDVLPEYY